MDAEEFKCLSLEERAEQLLRYGVKIDTIIHYGFTVRLYSLYNFYVEVYFNPAEKQLENITIPQTNELMKYVDWITLRQALAAD